MMQTKLDEDLRNYHHAMESKPYIEREDIQALLDACRVKFSVDLVFVGELMPEEDLIEFTYVSVSDEKYSILGHKCSVKGEKGDEPLQIDDEGISTRGRKSVFGDGADRMIFYGLISEKQYNGCVGMIDYHRKRNWTKEERAALQKMGRSLKYVLYEELANRTNRVAETRIDKQSLALQAFFETTDCGMMRHSLDGKKVFSINKAALKILGYETKEELEKAGFNAVAASVVDSDKVRLRAAMHRLKHVGDGTSLDYRVEHANGEIVEVIGGIKLMEEDGQLIYQRFLFDCTAHRVKEQEEVKNREQKYGEMIRALSREYNAVYFVSLDTGEASNLRISDDVIKRFGDEFIRNRKMEDTLAIYARKVVYEEDRDLFLRNTDAENLKEKIDEKGSYNFNYRIVRDEKIVYFQLRAVQVGEWGEKHEIAIGFRCVDDEVRAEMEQKRALEDALYQAERASRAKTIFLNNMSHDIRTPMNAIIGFTALARTHADEPELVNNYLEKIMTSGNHLLSLINDVLDMSRIESGKVKIEETACNLAEIMHDLKNIMQTDIRSKQLEFLIDTVDVVNEDVICDKLRLQQVLLNCLSNAMKFTKPGGTVSVRIIEKPDAQEGYASYEFKVRDTGIGMSKEFVEHIFEPFEREQTTTVSGIEGTGLGMAITKNIIDMMNGTITVESERGKGTEFTMAFQFRLSGERRKVGVIPQFQGLRALVADDDFNTCTSVAKMLASIGMRADWTTSGREAVLRAQFAKENKDEFHVYIIDWLMPDMNGIECVRRIRRRIGDSAPIIILTAYDWADIEMEAREAGVTAFCSKPLFLSELQETLLRAGGHLEQVDAEESEEMTLEGVNVLLVEDGELNREIAETILSEAGAHVESVTNGKLAVDRMQEVEADRYDLVLMDIQMPVMDGYEACRQIRKLTDPKKSHIPIIAMTANAFKEDQERAAEAGMDGHLSKPVEIPKLYSMIHKFVKTVRYNQNS